MSHLLEYVHRTAATRLGDISYLDRGDGPVALFVHGIGTNALLWRNVIELVSPSRRCVAVDLPLLGLSPFSPDQDVSLGGLADIVLSFVDALGVERVDPVGHDTGVRLLPVAGSLAAASIIGTKLAVTIGTKAVIAGGLGLLGIVYVWISTVSAATTYPEIVAQMLLLGTGMGLTSTPATEAILGAVSKDKAGIGSAVNDATRELGGTLGVAVIGSVFTSLYIHHVQANRLPGVPNPAITAARNGIGAAYLAADRLTAAGAPSDAANNLLAVARAGFFQGLHAGCLVAAGVAASGALFAALVLPNHPEHSDLA